MTHQVRRVRRAAVLALAPRAAGEPEPEPALPRPCLLLPCCAATPLRGLLGASSSCPVCIAAVVKDGVLLGTRRRRSASVSL